MTYLVLIRCSIDDVPVAVADTPKKALAKYGIITPARFKEITETLHARDARPGGTQ